MRTRDSLGRLVVHFFIIAASLLTAAGACAWLLPAWPARGQTPSSLFPPAFAASTACLLFGSWALSRADAQVVREQQTRFRRSLRLALVAGTCFVAVQGYALVNFFQQQRPVQAATGATSFVAVAASLHGMHFLIAWLFLVYVVLQAGADRYDHEYHWGGTFCAWFWHALAIVWLLVLCVMAIASQGMIDDGISLDPNLQ